ncbi:exonuclease [Hamiltosporidium tvaerminnensis]|uniref:Exonuclease n=1 Tax=Hamiltosporidium tvaerminnensis TaxID=1176355 RepID=A0A4Q9LWS0_9MICR|nr:exonuclease [Hamiltosporidium tvaerminnensis]
MDEVWIKIGNITSLTVEQLQKMFLWMYAEGKKPSFVTSLNKQKLKSTNLFFIDEKIEIKIIKKKFKLRNTAYMQEKFDINILIRTLFRKIERNAKPDISLITETEVEKFCIKNISKIYVEDSTFVKNSESVEDISTVENLSKNKNLLKQNEIKNENKIDNKILILTDESENLKLEEYLLLNKEFTIFTDYINNFIVSIDCEMVKTSYGKEVGRVSILDNQCNVIYDKIIKPEAEIMDYLTEYSGLDKDSFEHAVSFLEMKNDLKKIIGKNTIILGHSLFNDLNVLKIYHDRLIDTSHLYKTKDNYKTSLKNLSKKYLNKEIQSKSHCSIEDAKVCLELLALKINELKDLVENDSANINYNTQINIISIFELSNYIEKRNINIIKCSYEDLDVLDCDISKKNDCIFMFFTRGNSHVVCCY